MAERSIMAAFERIKSLKVQGKGAVRREIVGALRKSIKASRAKTEIAFRRELRRNAVTLLHARPTEPEARTAVRIILKAASIETERLHELKSNVLRTIGRYEQDREEAMEKMALYGSRLVEKGDAIMTHCHSDTVAHILKKARKKISMVYCTETRPLFQGRITAAELHGAGIPVTMIVDSAADRFMHKADHFFSGCDAVLSDGSIVNKIGTMQIAMSAKKHDVPYYACTSSHAFDPATYFGFEEKIEERPWQEIWKEKPAGVHIRNPAFDLVDEFYVRGIVTELGVFAPKMFALEMYGLLGLWKRQKPFFGLLDSIKEHGRAERIAGQNKAIGGD